MPILSDPLDVRFASACGSSERPPAQTPNPMSARVGRLKTLCTHRAARMNDGRRAFGVRFIVAVLAVCGLLLGHNGPLAAPMASAASQGMSSKTVRIDVEVQVRFVNREDMPSRRPYLELNTAYHQGALYSLLVHQAEVQLFRGDFMREMVAASKNPNPAAAMAGLNLPPDIDILRADGVRRWDLTREHPPRGSGEIALSGADIAKWALEPGHGQPVSLVRCAQDLSRGLVWYSLPDVKVRDPGGPIDLWKPTSYTLSHHSAKGQWDEAIARSKRACPSYAARPYQNGLFIGSFLWADLEAGKRIDLATDYDAIVPGTRSSYENHIHITVAIGTDKPVEAELIVLPEKYDSWLPEPGPDEGTPGPLPLTVTLKLSGKGQKAPGRKVASFEVRLKETSRQPGIALNMPLSPAANPGPDLRFLAEGGVIVRDEGQSATVPSPDGKTGKCRIAAFDGGAWSTLTVEAVLEGGSRIPRIQGHLERLNGPTDILLPKRSASSKIASSWLAAFRNPRDDADAETAPGTGNQGDGLSVYEEYRGLVAKGKYRRLDPQRKKLLIEVQGGLSTSAARGFALFEAASGIKVIELDSGELAADRVVNRNAGYAHLVAQHGLRLSNGNLPPGVLGRNEPEGKKEKTPKDSVRVVIDLAQIESAFNQQADVASREHVQLPFTREEYRAAAIAHEIAHGVGGDHHGPSSDQPTNYTAYPPGSSRLDYRIYGSDGTEIRTRPFTIEGPVGSVGGDESGDLSCLMAYTDRYQWAFSRGEGNALVYRAVPLLKLGSRFCASPAGTGINAESPGLSFFGNATSGNCAARLKVRDD